MLAGRARCKTTIHWINYSKPCALLLFHVLAIAILELCGDYVFKTKIARQDDAPALVHLNNWSYCTVQCPTCFLDVGFIHTVTFPYNSSTWAHLSPCLSLSLFSLTYCTLTSLLLISIYLLTKAVSNYLSALVTKSTRSRNSYCYFCLRRATDLTLTQLICVHVVAAQSPPTDTCIEHAADRELSTCACESNRRQTNSPLLFHIWLDRSWQLSFGFEQYYDLLL